MLIVMVAHRLCMRPIPLLSGRRAMRCNFERSFYVTSASLGLLFSNCSCVLAFLPLFRPISTTSTSTLKSVLQPEEWKHVIHEAWQTSETDGILKLAPQIESERYDVQDLVIATLDALPSKGQAAGVLNAWIGSCCQLQNPELGAERAWQLLDIYDSLEDLDPDLVTLSLVYTALTHPDLTDNFHSMGRATLERAQRLAKKKGGSKRRKSLAASARKQVSERSDLLELHGIQVMHESDRDLVVNKPSGMVCVHKFTTTSGKVTASRRKNQRENNGSGDWDISLEAALLDAGISLSTINTDGRGLVHRIDRGTSGCIVLAKTDERHAQLVSDFFLRNVKKDYLALVTLPQQEDILNSGKIDTPVQGRPALSFYTVEERFDTLKARLRIQTLTGRKHQVRVHCAEGLNAPIVGDTKYASDKPGENNQEKERFCLHASCLQVPGIPKIEAAVPTWWEQVM
jgi:23S rRNA-/tRNA-specific pseudouridylate synthase